MVQANALKIKLFADGADLDGIKAMYANPLIKGFTTNPTLMRKAGVEDYEAFGRAVLAAVPDRPVSLEVFADDFDTMIEQARTIASWGRNVNVKIPVSTTAGQFSGPVIKSLAQDGIVLNITAIMTVFAGRVADTGRDPVPLMQRCRDALRGRRKAELLWASPRELLNIFQADEVGCHIITATNDLLAKL